MWGTANSPWANQVCETGAVAALLPGRLQAVGVSERQRTGQNCKDVPAQLSAMFGFVCPERQDRRRNHPGLRRGGTWSDPNSNMEQTTVFRIGQVASRMSSGVGTCSRLNLVRDLPSRKLHDSPEIRPPDPALLHRRIGYDPREQHAWSSSDTKGWLV